jgi:hypothetical protein
MDNGRETDAWLRVTSKSYDLVFTHDATGACGRLHLLAYRLDNREDVLRAADLYTEHSIPIENGPGKHPIGQIFFVYVYEPGATGSSCARRATRLSRRTGSRCAGPRRSVPAASVGRVNGRELPHLRDACAG